jgi:hypothetical protein
MRTNQQPRGLRFPCKEVTRLLASKTGGCRFESCRPGSEISAPLWRNRFRRLRLRPRGVGSRRRGRREQHRCLQQELRDRPGLGRSELLLDPPQPRLLEPIRQLRLGLARQLSRTEPLGQPSVREPRCARPPRSGRKPSDRRRGRRARFLARFRPNGEAARSRSRHRRLRALSRDERASDRWSPETQAEISSRQRRAGLRRSPAHV